MTPTPDPGEKILEDYLRRVAEAMAHADRDPDEIDAARDGLREQVLEMVDRDSGDRGPAERMERAIASLDAPETYGSGRPAATRIPRRRGLALLSATCCVVGAFVVVAIGFLDNPAYEDPAGGAFVISQLVALAAGVVAWRDPWGRFGAVAAGLLLLLLGVVLALSA